MKRKAKAKCKFKTGISIKTYLFALVFPKSAFRIDATKRRLFKQHFQLTFQSLPISESTKCAYLWMSWKTATVWHKFKLEKVLSM